MASGNGWTSRAVLITGCSSGIGWATAERLAKGGWTVYATARDVEALAPLEERGCRLLPLDVTDEGSMRRAVEEVERAEGAVGVLLNNAGFEAGVARTTRENYERGPLARLGGGPEAVAETIEHAISVARPRTRYAVTLSAKLLISARRILPDRVWDVLLRYFYPQPGV